MLRKIIYCSVCSIFILLFWIRKSEASGWVQDPRVNTFPNQSWQLDLDSVTVYGDFLELNTRHIDMSNQNPAVDYIYRRHNCQYGIEYFFDERQNTWSPMFNSLDIYTYEDFASLLDETDFSGESNTPISNNAEIRFIMLISSFRSTADYCMLFHPSYNFDYFYNSEGIPRIRWYSYFQLIQP